jgi:hypothetical protein
MSSNVRSESDKEWKRALEKYPFDSEAKKFAEDHPYDTVEANFPTAAADPFQADILPKHDINLDSALHEIKNVIRPSPEKVEETKKMLNNFKDKVANYPKRMSYEGSMVLCVMLSMKAVATPNINNLPVVDQELIHGMVQGEYGWFEVTFDDNKDFLITLRPPNRDKVIILLINAVAHPTADDLKDVGAGTVPIERDGDKIAVGGKIILKTKTIQKLLGQTPKEYASPVDEIEDYPSKRQPVSGRNAYEIRADVLQMAVDWSGGKCQKPEDVVEVANKFYAFVEDKRRR